MGHVSLGSVIIKVIYISLLTIVISIIEVILTIVISIINVIEIILIMFSIIIMIISIIMCNFYRKTIDCHIMLCYNKGKEGMRWSKRY